MVVSKKGLWVLSLVMNIEYLMNTECFQNQFVFKFPFFSNKYFKMRR